VKNRPTILIFSSAVALMLYIGGYFVVVDKQLRNPFISWPIRRPLPMVEYYRVASFRVIYQPAVWLDKKLFPKRWEYPRTSKEELAAVYKNIDPSRIAEMSKLSSTTPEPKPTAP
jgi:hypothetical protein